MLCICRVCVCTADARFKDSNNLNITHVVETVTNLSPVSLVPSPLKGTTNLIWKFNYRHVPLYILLSLLISEHYINVTRLYFFFCDILFSFNFMFRRSIHTDISAQVHVFLLLFPAVVH